MLAVGDSNTVAEWQWAGQLGYEITALSGWGADTCNVRAAYNTDVELIRVSP